MDTSEAQDYKIKIDESTGKYVLVVDAAPAQLGRQYRFSYPPDWYLHEDFDGPDDDFTEHFLKALERDGTPDHVVEAVRKGVPELIKRMRRDAAGRAIMEKAQREAAKRAEAKK